MYRRELYVVYNENEWFIVKTTKSSYSWCGNGNKKIAKKILIEWIHWSCYLYSAMQVALQYGKDWLIDFNVVSTRLRFFYD